MVSTRKRRSNRRPLSQLDDFDQDIIIGNTLSNKQENPSVNEGTVDQEFTVGNSDSYSGVNENWVKVKTLERFFNERIDKELGNIVDTVGESLQNAILTAIDSIITPKIVSATRSINASSGRDATNVMASSERGEDIGITAPFEMYPKGIIHYVLNTNDETRNKIPDEVSEMSVPDTHFDRQPRTHHKKVLKTSKVVVQNQPPILIHRNAKPIFYNNDSRNFKQIPL